MTNEEKNGIIACIREQILHANGAFMNKDMSVERGILVGMIRLCNVFDAYVNLSFDRSQIKGATILFSDDTEPIKII